LAVPSQNTRSRTAHRKGAHVVQTRFVPPWITPLSPVPREDQEDATEMEEASPSPVFSQPPGFPKVRVVDPASSRPGTTTGADWFSGPDDLGWPLRSVWIRRRSSWTPTTSPPLLRTTRSLTSVPPSFQMVACSMALEDISELLHEVPPCSHGVDGPLSLRSLLSFRGPRTQRSR